MADRDVEINVTASDRTGMALASAERNFKRTSDRVKKDNDKLGESLAEVGSKVGPKLTSSLTEAFSLASKQAVPILVGVAVAASPFIGAAISGAVIGGAGIGGVVGGVILASHDARVQAAGKQLGQSLLSSLEQDASVFVGPVLEGIDKIQSAFDGAEDHIQSIFQNSARYVAPLTDGLIGFLDPVIEGFDELVANAAPVIEAIRQGMILVGEAIGNVFHDMSENGEEAAIAIWAAFKFVSNVIEGVGTVINWLTDAFGWLIDVALKLGIVNDEAKTAIEGIRAAGDGATGSLGNLADGFLKAGDEAATGAPKVEAFAQSIQDSYRAAQSLFDAETSVGEALNRLSESVKENGKSLDSNTEKGRNNRHALSGLVTALNAQYDATVKVNGEGRASDDVAAENYRSFIKAATGLGISKKAAEDYATKLGLIPPRVRTDATFQNTGAKKDIEAYLAMLRKIPAHKRTVIETAMVVTGNTNNAAVAAALRKQNFDAMNSFAFAGGPDAGTFRTGGPNPVSVQSNVGVSVSLDGKPFREMTTRAIDANDSRKDFRQKVGTR